MIDASLMPDRIRRLPRDKRGYPIPRFVAYVDGVPQFPIADARWVSEAYRGDLCYLCGGKLTKYRASVIGPMCAVNRTISEPPSHTDCARFAAQHCPFLANPSARRVPDSKLKQICPEGGHGEEAILRNPGAVCVWIATSRSKPFRTPTGATLFGLPEPASVEWYCKGQAATRADIWTSIRSGLPLLQAECEREATELRREQAREELGKAVIRAIQLMPAA